MAHADAPSADVTLFQMALRAGRLGPYVYVALLGLRRYDPLSIDAHIRRGLAYSAFERFSRNAELTLPQLAEATRIPARTLARRKEEGRLDPAESDRLARMSRLFAKVLELFEGETTAARDWLSKPQSALGGRVPLELAETDETQAVGDRWVRERHSVILRVPSAIVASECTYLPNVTHPDFAQVCSRRCPAASEFTPQYRQSRTKNNPNTLVVTGC